MHKPVTHAQAASELDGRAKHRTSARARAAFVLLIGASGAQAAAAADSASATEAATNTAKIGRASGEAPIEVAQAEAAAIIGGEAIAEVIVNGVHRRSIGIPDLSALPSSISLVTGEELEKQQITNFRDVIKRIGNIKWGGTSTNPTTTALSLRGVGYLGSGGALGIDSSVNTTVDGVPYIISNMAVFNSYYDLESVDVARGPQGSSGGYTASLGKISFTSRAPGFEREAAASLTYGQLNTVFTRGVLGGAIIDNLLAYRLTFIREQADGPFENRYYRSGSNGGNEVSYLNTDRTSAKLQFLLTPSERLRARLSFDITPNSKEYGISSNGGILPVNPPAFYDTLGKDGNPVPVDMATQDAGRLSRRWFAQNENWTYAGNYLRESNRSEHYPIANSTRGASANLSWLLDRFTLTSISAWRDYHFDFGSPNFNNPTPFDIQRGPSSGLGYFRQTTQELRLSSAVGGAFEYEAGVFFADVFRTNGGVGRGNYYGADAGAYYATPAQYGRLDNDPSGRYLLANSLDRLRQNSYAAKDDNSLALYGNFRWSLSERLKIDAGLRLSQEKRRADTNWSLLLDNGNAAELNPVQVNDVPLGGFGSYASNGTDANGNSYLAGDLTSGNSTGQLALADFTARKYFGVDSYNGLTAAQKRLVADAKAIRAARLTGLYLETGAEPFDELLFSGNFSPSFRFNDQYTAYFSLQYGEKAGVSQIVGATQYGGTSLPTQAEKNSSYEVGLRLTFLGGSLTVNTTLFYQDIKDYVANLYFYDEASTVANNSPDPLYISGVGNVPHVRSQGVELDIAYSDARNSLRLSGSYSDAIYKDHRFQAKPLELGGRTDLPPYQDVSGRRLPGAGPFSFNLFAEHIWPVATRYEAFANANYNYSSSFLTDAALSRYSKVDGYGLTDVSIGFGTSDRSFEASLLVKNLFDVDYGVTPIWNIYAPSIPRWTGVTIGAKF
jgi:iron complex outermembrane receptor protein